MDFISISLELDVLDLLGGCIFSRFSLIFPVKLVLAFGCEDSGLSFSGVGLTLLMEALIRKRWMDAVDADDLILESGFGVKSGDEFRVYTPGLFEESALLYALSHIPQPVSLKHSSMQSMLM